MNLNGEKILSNAKGYVGKTVTATKIKGGKHLHFNNQSALLKERGITDMWCYSHPETGNPMLQLEDKKGNLIREFNLKNQLEQIRNYFKNANAYKNEAIAIKRRAKELNKKCEEFDGLISGHKTGPDDYVYTVYGKEFDTYSEAKREALKLRPDLKKVLEQREEFIRNYIDPEIKKYLK